MKLKPTSLFRKIAPFIWSKPGDPSVYGFIELDVTQMTAKKQILPVFLKCLNDTFLKHPELGRMVKWGKVVQRTENMISVMVNIPKPPHKDLSALMFQADEKHSVQTLEELISNKSNLVRSEKDPHLGPLLSLARWMPIWILRLGLYIYSFVIYRLNLNLKILPHRPFGSVIVSNVGSLGIKKALLPLVPIANASMMISIGEICDEVRVFEGQISIRKILHVGITFDHRLYDGIHVAEMLRSFEELFKEQTHKLANQ